MQSDQRLRLVASAEIVGDVFVSAEHVYWTVDDLILRAPKYGGEAEQWASATGGSCPDATGIWLGTMDGASSHRGFDGTARGYVRPADLVPNGVTACDPNAVYRIAAGEIVKYGADPIVRVANVETATEDYSRILSDDEQLYWTATDPGDGFRYYFRAAKADLVPQRVGRAPLYSGGLLAVGTDGTVYAQDEFRLEAVNMFTGSRSTIADTPYRVLRLSFDGARLIAGTEGCAGDLAYLQAIALDGVITEIGSTKTCLQQLNIVADGNSAWFALQGWNSEYFGRSGVWRVDY